MSFKEIFPPVKNILEMAPEKVALLVLEYLSFTGRQKLNKHNFSLIGNSSEFIEWAEEHKEDVLELFMLAWAWLEKEFFIVSNPGQIDWYSITKKGEKILEVEKKSRFSQYLKEKQLKPIVMGGDYIDKSRLQSLKKKSGKFDFSRLLQMLKELDHAFSIENHISVILLVRAVLDHVPPIFGLGTFSEVANNYGTKSFKESMLNLENSSRKIADSYLHTRIRKKESLPSRTQVNFSNDLDVLLAEIIRIS